MKHSPPGLHPRRDEPRRPRDEGTPSDVVRFRGVAVAAGVLVVTLLGLVAYDLGFDGVRSPGPLSRSHRARGLACDDCHAAASASAACPTCHAAVRFSRAGHARSFGAGVLACSDCHRAHGFDGVRFEPDGSVYVTERGIESAYAPDLAFRPRHDVTLPFVATASCARCHRIDDPADVSSMCTGSFGGKPLAYSLCFDEHGRSNVPRSVRGGSRDVAGQAARSALIALEPSSSVRARPWIWLAAALGAAALALVATRRFPRARSRPAGGALALPQEPPRVVRLPRIDATTCLGCYACVDACPYDVLAVQRFVAVVERPDECCGLTLCEQRCPNGSLVVISGPPIADRPRIDQHFESLDVPGLYLAGDLTGVPLIKNAIAQGEHVARRVAEKRDLGQRVPADRLDLLIVGAGPAGIGAALEAKAVGLNCVALEQGNVAESIRSFPRHKIVLAQTTESDRPMRLWLEECRKEELLARWQRTVRRERLDIREGLRVVGVERRADGFEVAAVDRDGASQEFLASSVLLANGRRGTPRKLHCPVPADAQGSVFYSLADARSFAGQHVVVVGLGDVALEAIAALAAQPETTVTVSYRGKGFRRGKARNVAAVQRLAERGRIELCFESEATAVRDKTLVVATPAGTRNLYFDALFVMIGAIAPWDFLERCGMRRANEVDAGGSEAPRGGM